MKLLLLFLCVNLSSGLSQNGTGQEGGVNLSPDLSQNGTGQEGGVNLSSGLSQNGTGQEGGVNWSPSILLTGHGQGFTTTVIEIRNMLNAIQSTPLTAIEGDSFNGECVYSQQTKRTRIEKMGFQLDHWAAVTCTFGVVTQGPRQYARLYRPSQTVPGISLQTFYLPLHGHNTASFMTVPRTLDPTFFVTATLTGCDIFVATAGTGHNLNCPLVVIHTNACGAMTTDVNQQEAIAVLSVFVDYCPTYQYQIQYRMASSNHKAIIDQGGYHYLTEYYNPEMGGIFFGYTFGGSSVPTIQPWVFCRKNGLTTSVVCHTT